MNRLRIFLFASTVMVVAACTSPGTGKSSHAIIGSGDFIAESGQTIRAEYRNNGTVRLIWPNGDTRTLLQARSASGARYTAINTEWWEHHGEATLTEHGEVVFRGTLAR
jgi:membrane-bound inhibitor of C-type lysozyme